MDRRLAPSDWNLVRAFLATAEAGSFSAAARALRSSQPTLGRQVTALEEELGLTLFERAGRKLRLTSAGAALLEHVRVMGEAASRVSLAAAGHASEVKGEVAIAATDLFSMALLPPVVQTLRQLAPRLEIRVVASNAVQDLTRREADIAIRHVRPRQSDLIARHIGDWRARLYAASSYLDAMGRPQGAGELDRHVFIAADDPERLLAVLRTLGVSVRRDQVAATTSSAVVMWEMVRSGLGMSMAPELIGERTAGVERALPTLPPITFPVWLVSHRELRTSRRIRVVFDALADALTAYNDRASPEAR